MDKKRLDKLLIQISRGDNQAFEQFYACTKRGVFSLLYSYFKNYEDAEDALQNVYLKVKLNAAHYIPGTNASAWLLQIAKNQALNELKRGKRLSYEESIEIRSEAEFSSGVTDVMKRTLSEEEQRIITLHVLWGYRHREIAEELGCPTGTVTSKYKRSIKKLKEALKEAEQ